MPSNIGTAYVQIEPSFDGVVSKIDKEMGGAGESGGNSFASGFGKVVGTAGKVVAGAVAAGTAAVGAFAKSSVDAGMTFDSSMSQVAATMGTTVDQIGELRDFAQQMGSTTAFSATEAADALNYMALAGYDAETSMSMLPNVLNLAAAGGIDLASASDMVTDASSALGLNIQETSEMVDQMAKASSKSNTSVAQLGEAFLTVGGTAKMLRGGTVELSQSLGILADNGVKGAEGGTALRNIILSLSAPTDKAAKQLQQLGINAFDASGNMLPLQDVMYQFNNAMKDMSDAEKTQALNNIFNKVDLKSVNALMATNVDRWNELRQSINGAWYSTESLSAAFEKNGLSLDTIKSNLEGLGMSAEDVTAAFDYADGSIGEFIDYIYTSTDATIEEDDILKALGGDLDAVKAAFNDTTGAAQAMADTQLDNLAGDITLFQSALEGAKIAVSDSLSPALREFVQFGADGMSQLTEAFKSDGLTGAMEALGGILADGISMIANKAPEMVNAGLELISALGQGLLDNLDTITQSAIEVITTLLEKFLAPDTIQSLLQAGIDLIVNLANGLAEALPELIPMAVEAILTIVDTLLDNIDLLVEAALNLIIALAEGLLKAMPKLVEKAPEIVLKLMLAIVKNAPLILEAAIKLIMTLVEGIVSNFGELVKAGHDIVEKVQNGFSDYVDNAINWGKDLIQNFIDGIMAKWESLKKTVSNVAKTVKDFLGFSEPEEGPLSNFHTFAPDMMKLYAQGITDNADVVKNALTEATTDIMGASYDVEAVQSVQASVNPGDVTVNDDRLGRIETLMAQFIDNFRQDIYLDTGALVGGTVNSFNSALGQLAVQGAKR